MRKSLGVIVTAISLGIASFSSQADEPLRVVTSFSILADMVEQVAGEHAEVISLVGPDSDTHAYSPSPHDARRLNEADLVVFNGLQFEGWMERLIDSSEYDGTLVTASDGIDPLATHEHHDHDHEAHDHHEQHHVHHQEHHGHQHGEQDPHAWLDAQRGQHYVRNIRDGLIEADPDNADAYREGAQRYLAELETLDAEIHSLIETIPEAQRVVVTGHDAFGYFADAYGMRFLSVVGLNTAAAPSAADMGRLVDTLRNNDIRALFHENITNPATLRQLSEESGLPIAGTLYSGALASEGEASSYAGMMHRNATLMHEVLSEPGHDAQGGNGHNHDH